MGEARAGDAAAIESRLFALRVSGRGCAARSSLNPQLSLGGEGVLVLVEQVKVKYQVQEKSGKRVKRCDERGEITSTIDVKPVCHAKYNVPCCASSGLHVLTINRIASRTPYAAQHWHSGTASGAVLGAVYTSKFACNFMSLKNVSVVVIQSDIGNTARCPIENLLSA
jgi:hypothetical protein